MAYEFFTATSVCLSSTQFTPLSSGLFLVIIHIHSGVCVWISAIRECVLRVLFSHVGNKWFDNGFFLVWMCILHSKRNYLLFIYFPFFFAHVIIFHWHRDPELTFLNMPVLAQPAVPIDHALMQKYEEVNRFECQTKLHLIGVQQLYPFCVSLMQMCQPTLPRLSGSLLIVCW